MLSSSLRARDISESRNQWTWHHGDSWSKTRQVYNLAICLAELLDINTFGQMLCQIEDSSIVDPIDSTTKPIYHVSSTSPMMVLGHRRLLPSTLKVPRILWGTGVIAYIAKNFIPSILDHEDVGECHCEAVPKDPHGQLRDLPDSLLGLTGDTFRGLSY